MNTGIVSQPSQDKYTYNINRNFHFFQVMLVSVDGDGKAIGAGQIIKPSAIKSLVLEDALKDFYHKGYIIIDNSYDVIERDVTNGSDPSSPQYYSQANQPSNQNAGFLFKGESRDIMHIDIMPYLDQQNPNSLGGNDLQTVFRLSYDFVIYNSEEIPGDKPDQKFKKLYFWDLYYQLLSEKNVPFTTSNYINGNTTQLDDGERGIPTGLAIQALLGEAFPDTEGYPLSISYDDGKTIQTISPVNITSINNYTTKYGNNKNWDIGGGSLFFSAPSTYKALDSIDYILTRHISNSESDYNPCIMRLERYPRAMSLKSLKQYFSQAYDKTSGLSKEYYLETIKIGGVNQDNAKEYISHAYTPSDGLYMEKIGTINSFSFDNMPGAISQQELVTRFVHSYRYNDKQFNIDANRNSVQQSMAAYKKDYVDPMLSNNSTAPFTNFAPGQYRYTNTNIDNVFSVTESDSNIRLAYGRNRFLYASIMTNNLISFRLPGSTHRQAGRFIGIDRDGGSKARCAVGSLDPYGK